VVSLKEHAGSWRKMLADTLLRYPIPSYVPEEHALDGNPADSQAERVRYGLRVLAIPIKME
jgi:hypothetical protein